MRDPPDLGINSKDGIFINVELLEDREIFTTNSINHFLIHNAERVKSLAELLQIISLPK